MSSIEEEIKTDLLDLLAMVTNTNSVEVRA